MLPPSAVWLYGPIVRASLPSLWRSRTCGATLGPVCCDALGDYLNSMRITRRNSGWRYGAQDCPGGDFTTCATLPRPRRSKLVSRSSSEMLDHTPIAKTADMQRDTARALAAILTTCAPVRYDAARRSRDKSSADFHPSV